MNISPTGQWQQQPPPPPPAEQWGQMVPAAQGMVMVQTAQGVMMIPPNFVPVQTAAGIMLVPLAPGPMAFTQHAAVSRTVSQPEAPVSTQPPRQQPPPPTQQPPPPQMDLSKANPPKANQTWNSQKQVRRESNDEGVKEYRVDGETPIDDLMFASVFAKMDNEVLDHFKELANMPPPAAPKGDSASSANEDSDEDKDIDSSCIDADEIRNLNDFFTEFKTRHPVDGDEEDGGTLVEEDAELCMIPEDLDLTRISDDVSGDIRPIGSVIHDMQTLINVKACESPSIFDVGSICCNGRRKVIGIIVDTIGPVVAPFYIVRRLKEIPVQPDETIFVDMSKSSVAEIVTVEEDDDEVLDDDVRPTNV
eukprot:Blabericola_migrator_1__4005@NODE_2216_length_3111_cov_68_766754_g1395_i0_p1_GENE_NODE_2216_length_3111_cov_68_766754_g1395_i0NODE_2216_length_3111_cov_68_766754_g1395_i0_p1_ORF_typecomplete_len363_score81_76Gar1/PF04410_14/4_2e03Gar1/PF04410_14/9_5e11DUF4106/PF13388_6/0_2_NODE_2216_length_3111_cov_68_766754_g1395_i0741162